jgi:hypothetical protein
MALNPTIPLLFGAAFFLSSQAHAQTQAQTCKTANGQCSVSALPPQGTDCHCPDSPGVMGIVGVTGAGAAIYPGYQPHQREHLRNDDIDDDGDVLAGPRRHHKRAYSEDYDSPDQSSPLQQ